jgi:hypothetical protein
MDIDTVWLVVIVSQLCLFTYLIFDAGMIPELVGAYTGWVRCYSSSVALGVTLCMVNHG